MAKVFMMCGKLCSGKSTHAEMLRKEHKAVILSIDEITLALFGQDAGEKHDDYVKRARKYLYEKSLDIIEMDINVILDWGFGTKKEREFAREFYCSRNIPFEFHYIDIDDEEWKRRMEKRNKDVLAGKTNAYYVVDGLITKLNSMFEKPDRSEIDMWIDQMGEQR